MSMNMRIVAIEDTTCKFCLVLKMPQHLPPALQDILASYNMRGGRESVVLPKSLVHSIITTNIGDYCALFVSSKST